MSSRTSPRDPLQSHSRSLKAVEEFFSANQPIFATENHVPGKSTRVPGDFDLHLAPEQRLRHIYCIPGLANDLRNLASSCLSDSSLVLPEIKSSHLFPDRVNRGAKMKQTPHKNIQREADIQEVFEKTTSRWCTVVASQISPELATTPGVDWDRTKLSWTISSVPPKYARNKAAGSKKNYRNPGKPQPASSVPASKAASDNEAPEDSTDDEQNGPQKTDTKQTKRLGPTPRRVNRNKQAPKSLADGYLWLTSKSTLSAHSNCLGIYEFKSMTAADLEKMAKMAYSFQDGTAFEGAGCPLNNGCLLNHHNFGVQRCKMGLDAEECVLPSVQDAIDGKIPEITSEDYKNVMDRVDSEGVPLQVCHMIQQIWGEACYKDVTFIVFSAGNIEIIGIRHRESQTLFLSEIIDVPKSQYYKLHTGLNIAAVRDLDRRQQRTQNEGSSLWKDFDIRIDWRHASSENVRDLVREELKSRPWLSLEMVTELQTFHPFREKEPYYLVADESTSWQAAKATITEDNYFWISFPRSFEDSKTNIGLLNLPKIALPEGVLLPNIVARVAEGEYQVDALELEWKLAKLSSLKHMIYGYYEYQGYEEHPGISDSQTTMTPAAVLLMDDSRKSVAEWCNERSETPDMFITHQQWLGFHKALDDLLQLGFYLSVLEARNLAIKGNHDSTDVSLCNLVGIAFRAEEGQEWRTIYKRKSNAQLTALVGNPAQRKREEEDSAPDADSDSNRPFKKMA